MNSFYERLLKAQKSKQTCLCVGLDPQWDLLPEPVKDHPAGFLSFLRKSLTGRKNLAVVLNPRSPVLQLTAWKRLSFKSLSISIKPIPKPLLFWMPKEVILAPPPKCTLWRFLVVTRRMLLH